MVRALLDEVELLVLAIPEVLTESEFVSTCTCDEDAYCYGCCLRNYDNQTEQHELSRGEAEELLVSLL